MMDVPTAVALVVVVVAVVALRSTVCKAFALLSSSAAVVEVNGPPATAANTQTPHSHSNTQTDKPNTL